jgi:hypothetical protein
MSRSIQLNYRAAIPPLKKGRSASPRYVETGQVKFPWHAAWWSAFVDVYLVFPKERVDDQLNALAYAIVRVRKVVVELGADSVKGGHQNPLREIV